MKRYFMLKAFQGMELHLLVLPVKFWLRTLYLVKTSEMEAFEKIKHRNFPGGRLFRMPLLVTISAMQRMMDIFNV